MEGKLTKVLNCPALLNEGVLHLLVFGCLQLRYGYWHECGEPEYWGARLPGPALC